MKIWLPYVVCGSGTDVFTRRLETFFNAAGHTAVATPFAHNLQYFPAALKLAKAPQDFDIVVANSWNGFAFKRARRPLVVVEHLCVFDPALAPYLSFAQKVFHRAIVYPHEKISVLGADKWVAVSRYTGRAAKTAFGASDPNVIHNGVDTEFFSPPPEPRTRSGPFRILYVGNLSKRKGADLLPLIMAKLGPQFELRYTSGLRAAETFKPQANMRSIGRLDQHQMRTAYHESDVVLFPSRLEGLSYAAAEAMACGVPLIATDSSSFPEMIEDGISGRLCPVDDVDAFVEAIRSYAEAPAVLARARTAARAAAVQKFDAAVMGRKYLELLLALVPSVTQ